MKDKIEEIEDTDRKRISLFVNLTISIFLSYSPLDYKYNTKKKVGKQ